MFNQNQNFMNAVDLASLILGILNMQLNIEQAQQNDANGATDRQTRLLLDEIGKRLDAQDAMLSRILEPLEKD